MRMTIQQINIKSTLYRLYIIMNIKAEEQFKSEVKSIRKQANKTWFLLSLVLTTITETALDAIPVLTVMDELDSSPTTEEFNKALDNLACGKAPGSDPIPAEVLKSGKPDLLKHPHELLCLCWEESHIPQDMRDTNIVT